MISKKKMIGAIMLPLLVVGLLTGCGTANATPAEPEIEPVEEVAVEPEPEEPAEEAEQIEEPTPEPGPEFKIIGREDEEAFKVMLTNNVGQNIIGLEIKRAEDEDYQENMLPAEEMIEQGETVELYYNPADADEIPEFEHEDEAAAAAEEADGEATDEEVLFVESYNVQLTFEDGTIVELVNFGFDDMDEVDILFEDDVAFIKYISIKSGEPVDTKEAQLALLDDSEGEDEQVTEESSSSNDTSSNQNNDPAPAPEPEPEQDVDQCIDEDEVVWNDDADEGGEE